MCWRGHRLRMSMCWRCLSLVTPPSTPGGWVGGSSSRTLQYAGQEAYANLGVRHNGASEPMHTVVLPFLLLYLGAPYAWHSSLSNTYTVQCAAQQ
jgi:hypothetical protein